MESMNPLLHLILQLRLSIERGEPLRSAIRSYLAKFNSEMTTGLAEWLFRIEQGRVGDKIPAGWNTSYRQAMLSTLGRGLRGEPVLQTLIILEEEVFQFCLEELDRKTALLPIQCLGPLLFLQFPALLGLILGPLMHELLGAL